jgi:ABC-type sulfate/molybdate transport systems ATPase subunit
VSLSIAAVTIRTGTFALGPLTWHVPPGTIAALTGPAGAGKSTLLETIAGLRAPASGTIAVDDVDVTRAAPEQRGIGLVPQHALLFDHLSVRENIAYGARTADAVAEAIDCVQCDALLRAPVASLSGGERQTIALARAVAAAPRVLLLDEPFAAMDEALHHRLRARVFALLRARTTTAVLVTHDPADLDGLAVRLDLRASR